MTAADRILTKRLGKKLLNEIKNTARPGYIVAADVDMETRQVSHATLTLSGGLVFPTHGHILIWQRTPKQGISGAGIAEGMFRHIYGPGTWQTYLLAYLDAASILEGHRRRLRNNCLALY